MGVDSTDDSCVNNESGTNFNLRLSVIRRGRGKATSTFIGTGTPSTFVGSITYLKKVNIDFFAYCPLKF